MSVVSHISAGESQFYKYSFNLFPQSAWVLESSTWMGVFIFLVVASLFFHINPLLGLQYTFLKFFFFSFSNK